MVLYINFNADSTVDYVSDNHINATIMFSGGTIPQQLALELPLGRRKRKYGMSCWCAVPTISTIIITIPIIIIIIIPIIIIITIPIISIVIIIPIILFSLLLL